MIAPVVESLDLAASASGAVTAATAVTGSTTFVPFAAALTADSTSKSASYKCCVHFKVETCFEGVRWVYMGCIWGVDGC